MMAIAQALTGRGHAVTVLSQRCIEGRARAAVVVHDHLPHAALLPRVSAVITHADLGTVAAALSHGVPIVCTPIDRDQPLNASRVEGLGAGVTVPASTPTPDAVRAALHEVLTDDRYRLGARHLADASARAGGATSVADDLERLGRGRREPVATDGGGGP